MYRVYMYIGCTLYRVYGREGTKEVGGAAVSRRWYPARVYFDLISSSLSSSLPQTYSTSNTTAPIPTKTLGIDRRKYCRLDRMSRDCCVLRHQSRTVSHDTPSVLLTTNLHHSKREWLHPLCRGWWRSGRWPRRCGRYSGTNHTEM